jgi:aspartyl-tRNA(Asn)/glutamyl-tRNA(Gln) amidotransferase subunit A
MKPTAATVLMRGAVPCSRTLGSVGPIARDMRTVRRAYDGLAVGGQQETTPITTSIIMDNSGMNDLDGEMSVDFDEAVWKLQALGFGPVAV